MASHKEDELISEVELLVADQVGALMEFWGFKRVLGRIWTVLYLSDEPLTAAEIGSRLKLSASAVSVALTELKQWGVVQEALRIGAAKRTRAQTWRAETDIWQMVTNVIRQRELRLVRRFEGALQEALEILEDLPTTPRIKHLRQALKSLSLLAATGRTMLDALLNTGRINAEPLRQFRS
ncbi:MAG: MarR family transcriptional regulator [Myxococcota bacterium]